MVNRALKTFLRMFLKTCKTVSIKLCINREGKINISQFSYTFIVVTITTKSLVVVSPPNIFHRCSTRKTLCEDNSTPVNMRSCGCLNVRKYR